MSGYVRKINYNLLGGRIVNSVNTKPTQVKGLCYDLLPVQYTELPLPYLNLSCSALTIDTSPLPTPVEANGGFRGWRGPTSHPLNLDLQIYHIYISIYKVRKVHIIHASKI